MTARLAALALLLALPAASAEPEIDGYLSSKPAADKVVSETVGGLHSDKGASNPDANPLRCSSCTSQSPQDRGLADAALQKGAMMHDGDVSVPNRVPARAKSDAAAPAAASGSGAYPPFVARLKFKVFPNLPALPEHFQPMNSHGILRMRSPEDAYAVGFKTRPTFSDEHVHGGGGSIGAGPQAMPEGGCEGWAWISAKPGGEPVSDKCEMGPIGPGYIQGFRLDYAVLEPDFAKHFPNNSLLQGCVLEADTQYYFNVASGGWADWDTSQWNRGKAALTRCDVGLSSPLGDQ
jgi:hypothetical protein